MNRNFSPRVAYHPGQYLRHEDLTDDQAYHLGRHRRHLIAHHTWGIVRGLDLLIKHNTLLIAPGLAVDGYGRELVVGRRLPLPSSAFDELTSDTLDLWLTYDLQSVAPAPKGYSEPTHGAPTTVRWSEEPRLEWSSAEASRPDARHPPGVSEVDHNFGPERHPPDDPRLRWPVYLGRVRRRPGEENALQIDSSGRPYAGLVGHSLEPPWRDGTRMTLGAPAQPKDTSAFAVHLPDADGNPQPQLEMDPQGAVAIHGDTTVAGDLRLGGGLEFRLGATEPRSDDHPRPWQVYLAEDDGAEELRIELDGSQELHRVAIGAFSQEKQAFEPTLTVAANHTVTVHGDLVVEGLLIRGSQEAQPPMSPEVEGYLLGGYLGGLNAAGSAEQYGDHTSALKLLSAIARAAAQPELLRELAAQIEKEAPQWIEILHRILQRTTDGEPRSPWS